MDSIFSMRRIAPLLLLLTFTGISAYAQKVENSLFWKISGRGLPEPCYLFGTYHVLGSAYLKEVPKVKTAYENASGVIVETEIDSAKMLKLMPRMMMKDKRISDLMSEEEYRLVSHEVQEVMGMPMDMLAQFKPGFLVATMTLIYNQRTNDEFLKKYRGPLIDSYFASAARNKNKPVTTFETMEEQLALVFDHDPLEQQARQLVEFVKMKDEMIEAQAEMTKMYVEQDLAGMYRFYKKYEKQVGDMSYLNDDRNVKWMEKLPALLKGGNQFIAVGAFHFAGEKSLITLLRNAEYTVRPVPLK